MIPERIQICTLRGRHTVVWVEIEKIDNGLFEMTVGSRLQDDDDESCFWVVCGRKQALPAKDWMDACYKAHHLVPYIY